MRRKRGLTGTIWADQADKVSSAGTEANVIQEARGLDPIDEIVRLQVGARSVEHANGYFGPRSGYPGKLKGAIISGAKIIRPKNLGKLLGSTDVPKRECGE